MRLSSQDIIINANQLNPGAFTQLMLRDNSLGDIGEGAIFTPGFVQVETKDFELMVLTDKLQFKPARAADRQATVLARLGTIVQSLPYTPYTSIGLNFFWDTEPKKVNLELSSRKLFLKETCPLASDFSDGGPRFGAYFSKEMIGMRLRLTILPRFVMNKEGKFEHFQLSFSYSANVQPQTAVEDIRAALGRWGEAKDYSAKLAGKIEAHE